MIYVIIDEIWWNILAIRQLSHTYHKCWKRPKNQVGDDQIAEPNALPRFVSLQVGFLCGTKGPHWFQQESAKECTSTYIIMYMQMISLVFSCAKYHCFVQAVFPRHAWFVLLWDVVTKKCHCMWKRQTRNLNIQESDRLWTEAEMPTKSEQGGAHGTKAPSTNLKASKRQGNWASHPMTQWHSIYIVYM